MTRYRNDPDTATIAHMSAYMPIGDRRCLEARMHRRQAAWELPALGQRGQVSRRAQHVCGQEPGNGENRRHPEQARAPRAKNGGRRRDEWSGRVRQAGAEHTLRNHLQSDVQRSNQRQGQEDGARHGARRVGHLAACVQPTLDADERKEQEHRRLTDLRRRRHSDPFQVRDADGERAHDHEQHQGRDLHHCQNYRQPRAASRPADVHTRKDCVEHHQSNDAPHAHAKRGNPHRERVHEEIGHRCRRHHRVRKPQERARDAADHWTECRGRVGVEPTRVGDATPGFREAEPDQAHQHCAEQICEDRGRAQHRRGYSRQPKNAGADDAVDGGSSKTADSDHALEMRRGRALAVRRHGAGCEVVTRRMIPSLDSRNRFRGGSARTRPGDKAPDRRRLVVERLEGNEELHRPEQPLGSAVEIQQPHVAAARPELFELARPSCRRRSCRCR